MMKALSNLYSSFMKGRFYRHGYFRISSYYTQEDRNFSDILYNRLRTCKKQRLSVIPVLDKWVLEGRAVDYEGLKGVIRSFRKDRAFSTALEISEWMSEMKHFDLTAGGAAIHLDLISKVHGVEQAEKYFNGLEKRLQALPVYGALLNCYVAAKSLEKAEATMEMVRKLGQQDCLSYNAMLNLYSKLGKHNKMKELMQEMEEKGIVYTEFTYNIILHAYGTASDIEAMENLLMKMEVDPMVSINYWNYVTAANGYIKASASEKALEMVKKAEHLIKGPQRKFAYRVLITLYTTLKKKEDVHRLWDALDSYGKLYNDNYMIMIFSLVKFDDLVGAEKILKEWEEKTVHFDFGAPNTVISAYFRAGRVKEAETILNRLIENGKEMSANTWSRMALGYHKNAQMEKAVEMTKKAILSGSRGWRPDLATIAACLEHLKNEGNTDEIEEILMLLEKHGKFATVFKERLERYSLHEAKPSSEAC